MESKDNINPEMEEEMETSEPVDEMASESSNSKKHGSNMHQVVREKINLYYRQLTEGCGRNNCTNQHCASSSDFQHGHKDTTALGVSALELMKTRALLCEKETVVQNVNMESITDVKPTTSTEAVLKPTESSLETSYFTEKIMINLIETCNETKDWTQLIHSIGRIFGDIGMLLNSFKKSKEDISAMNIDQDKDLDDTARIPEDIEMKDTSCTTLTESSQTSVDPSMHTPKLPGSSTTATSNNNKINCTLDLQAICHCFDKLFNIDDDAPPFMPAMANALCRLYNSVKYDLNVDKSYSKHLSYINLFIIGLQLPLLQSTGLEEVLPSYFKAISALSIPAQAYLCRFLSQYCVTSLKDWMNQLQQLITVQIVSKSWQNSYPNDDIICVGSTKLLHLIYCTNLLASKHDDSEVLVREKKLAAEIEKVQNSLAAISGRKERRKPITDPLQEELGINKLDIRAPVIPFEDFINEPLSMELDINTDYAYYLEIKEGVKDKFSFSMHPFILTTATKTLCLMIDNRVRMLSERRVTIMQAMLQSSAGIPHPYLRLQINRQNVVGDAMLALEIVAADQPSDFKKQLYVEFEGEQGIDEGGVSKEFFQLIVEQIFNPDNGMFTYDENTKTFWFNATSFESERQFNLIGIILGLAIYNNVILDVRFPKVAYRKLLKKVGRFQDLEDLHPTLHRSLKQMLEYKDDVESTFMQTFQVSQKGMFGEMETHELKPGGNEISVTNENKQEFVDLYTDFLLNKSIEAQFNAFHQGFSLVTDESMLSFLFHPDELELLVCGSEDYDFDALESTTEYDGGFSKESQTVQDFWHIVHSFDTEQKRQLLAFTTGSDRIPVGGIAKLKLIIARNGPDADRLPTSHTCFNVILLPDYLNRDKLRNRLLLAITHSKGFGML